MKLLYVWAIFMAILCCIGWMYITHRDECRILRTIPTDNGTIEIVNEECQEALPHTTTRNIIRMTESVWNSGRYDEILKHERVHLDQKRKPREWEEFYRTAWNYELLSAPPPELSIADIRPNPDTKGKPWALWRGQYIFFPTYGPERTLRGAVVRVWDVVAKQFVKIPPEWRTEFCSNAGCPSQYEHPHEIAAEYVTKGHTSPSALKLFQWLK